MIQILSTAFLLSCLLVIMYLNNKEVRLLKQLNETKLRRERCAYRVALCRYERDLSDIYNMKIDIDLDRVDQLKEDSIKEAEIKL